MLVDYLRWRLWLSRDIWSSLQMHPPPDIYTVSHTKVNMLLFVAYVFLDFYGTS